MFENEKRVVLYFEENEKAVVFDIFFAAIYVYMKKKRQCSPYHRGLGL